MTEWHINADEPIALDYNIEFKSPSQVNTFYDDGPYRSSDHDPVLVGLDLNSAPVVDAGGPYTVAEGSTVTVTATGSDPDNDALTYAWDLDNNGSFETAGQSATFSADGIQAPASRTIAVRVTDTDGFTATDTATVNVIWNFSGFFPPVANLPGLNSVKAGARWPSSSASLETRGCRSSQAPRRRRRSTASPEHRWVLPCRSPSPGAVRLSTAPALTPTR